MPSQKNALPENDCQTALIAAAFALLPSLAEAEALIKGVYVTSQELCAKAKKDGIESVAEEGNLVLHANKIESIEYHCDFLDVKVAAETGLLVSAYCEEPGHAQPDLMTITQRGEGELEVTSVTDREDAPGTNSGLYYLCEGVTMP